MLGPYEVLQELAPGPSGARRVRARIPEGKPVVLSVGSPRGGMLELARYERLATQLEALECAHLLQLFDHAEGYLVWEDVPTQPWERSLESFPQLLDAIAAAHRGGVVHSELRPAWILHTDVGLKVDFTPALQGGDADLLELLPYMAPEQTNASPGEDPRVDIYALGVLLYEAATGRRPFEGDHPIDVIERILRAPVPSDPEMPLALDRVVRRALSKEPEARYASVEEFAEELSHHRTPVQLDEVLETPEVGSKHKPFKPFFQSMGVPRIASSDWLEEDD